MKFVMIPSRLTIGFALILVLAADYGQSKITVKVSPRLIATGEYAKISIRDDKPRNSTPENCSVQSNGTICSSLITYDGAPVQCQFNTSGTYTVQVTCGNTIDQGTVSVIVFEKLVGFQIDNNGKKMPSLRLYNGIIMDVLNFTYKHGSYFDVSSTNDSVQLSYNNKLNNGFLTFRPEFFNRFGEQTISVDIIYKVKLSEDCCVSQLSEKLGISINFEEAISDISPGMPPKGLLGANSNWTFTVSQGSNLVYILEGLFNVTVWQLCNQSGPTVSTFKFLPRQITQYNLNLTLINSVSSRLIQKEISVVKPVTNFQVVLKDSNVTLKSPGSEFFPMGELKAEVFDRGKVLSNVSLGTLKGGETRLLLSSLPSGNRPIEIRISSTVSTMQVKTNVSFWNPAEEKVTLISPYAQVGEAVPILFKNSVGWGFRYELDYGDGNSSSANRELDYFSEDFSVTYAYKKPGTFVIVLKIHSDSSVYDSNVTISVLDIQLLTNTSTASPGSSVSFTVILNGTDFSNHDCKLVGDKALDWEVFGGETIVNKFYESGVVNITLRCPYLPDNFTQWKAVSVREILPSDFTITYNSETQKNISAVLVDFTIHLLGISQIPADVKLLWDFDDDTHNESHKLDSWIKSHIFERRGFFNASLTLTASNKTKVFALPIQIGIARFVSSLSSGTENFDEFGFQLSQMPVPTANIRLDFGDNETEESLGWNVTTNPIFNDGHIYKRAGLYRPVATVWATGFYEIVPLAHLITVLPDPNLLTMAVTQSIQYPPGFGQLTFIAQGLLNSRNQITCSVDFDDGSTLNTALLFANSNETSFRHQFQAIGELKITANCSGENVVKQYLQAFTTVTSTCFNSNFSVFNIDNPLTKRISNELTISAEAGVLCNMTPAFIWKVDRVENGVSTLYQTPETNSTLLFLPARTMPEGEYIITFYMYFREAPFIFKSDNLKVVYEWSPLFASIKGGSLKTVGTNQQITLDGFTFSYDPDADRSFPNLTYSWTMTSHRSYAEASSEMNKTSGNCQFCDKIQDWTEGVLVLTPGCLPANQWYVFHLQISKGNRTQRTKQTIFVADNGPAQIDLRCKVNCMQKVNAEFSFNLETECLNCNENETTSLDYNWQLFRNSGSSAQQEIPDFAALTRTGTRIPTMSIKPYSLSPGEAYTLVLTVIGPHGMTTTVRNDVVVNYPPYNGTCHLTPAEGYAVYDRFKITCENWIDEHNRQRRSDQDTGKDLYYRFILWIKGKSSLLYAGGNRRTILQQFNVGDENDDYKVQVSIQITDWYKGMAEINLTTIVLPPTFRNAVEEESGLDTMLQDFQERISQEELNGDPHRVFRLVESAGSTLSSVDDNSTQLPQTADELLQEEVTELSKNKTGKTWNQLWHNYLSPESKDTNKKLTQAKTNYLQSVAASTNNSVLASLDAAYMAASSLRTLVANPQQVDETGLKAAVETGEVLGYSLSEGVNADMSDTQVQEVVQSTYAAIDGTMGVMIPSNAVENKPDDITLEGTRKYIEESRAYMNREKLKAVQEEMEKADMSDAERAFIITQSKLQQEYYDKRKQEMAKDAIPRIQVALDNTLNSAATFLVNGQEAAVFRAENMTSSVEMKPLKKVLHDVVKRDNVTIGVKMKTAVNESVNQDHPFTLKTTVYNRNPFTWGEEERAAHLLSAAVSVNLAPAGDTLRDEIIQTTGSYVVSIENGPVQTKKNITPQYIPLDKDQLLYHRMEMISTADTLMIDISSSQPNVVYEGYFLSGEFPTSADYDYHAAVKSRNEVSKLIKVPPRKLSSNGTIYAGLKPLALDRLEKSKKGAPNYTTSFHLTSGEEENETKHANYDISVAAAGCVLWKDPTVKWERDVCKLNNISDMQKTSCACDLSLSSIFTIASTFYLPVNTVDFSTVFTEIDLRNNASVFAVVVSLLGIYAMLIIWARRKDKTDIIKWGLTGLVDNSSEHKYLYIITVYTGMRLAAGTKSKVGFVIAGEKGDTGVRPLYDGIRTGFPVQSVMHYLMTVESCLGDLQYLRIWHDNSGKGPLASWFLHKVVVEDLQEDKKYIFACDKWLGVDEGDGLIERLLPVSSKENLLTFRSLFYHNARKHVTESHIWFSVLFRPQRSHFTRVQRLSCCVCLLFLSMICNALFYKSRDNIVNPATINIGFLRLSLNQVYNSLISIFVVTPVELAVIWLFKKSKPPDVITVDNGCQPCCLSKERIDMSNALLTKGFIKPKEALLPHFCVYIAWTMIILCIASSAFFVFLLSQQWGRAKSEEWLTAFLLTFFESLVLLDPLKVIVLAVFFALFIQKLEEDSHDLNKEELKANCGTGISSHDTDNPNSAVEPLGADEVARARVVRLRETKTFEVLKEIGLFLLFLVIMCSIAYTSRDKRSFAMKHNIYNLFVYKQQDGRPGLNDVTTVVEYFDWLNTTAIPAIFYEKYYNMTRRHWRDRQFIKDMHNYRVGPPRLKQVRVKTGPYCRYPADPSQACHNETTQTFEETSNFCIGWKSGVCADEDRAFKLTSHAWKYSSASVIWGMSIIGAYQTYSGGGYIAQLSVNMDVSKEVLKELFTERWIDEKTRLLTLDFTLFNPNTNLFCFVSLMAEFPGTGGTITAAHVSPIRIYQYAGDLHYFVFITEMTFVIILVVAIVKLILKLIKHGLEYLRDIWHLVDFVTIVACCVAIAMYGLRRASSEFAIEKYRSNPNLFINFQHVAFWDDLMLTMVGLVTFTCTVRTVKILGFCKRLHAIIAVLANARRDLMYFSLMISIFLMAFVACGYFMFGQNLSAYNTVLHTCETLMTSLVGKSPFNELRHDEPVTAQVYFSAFVFFFVFVLLTMFQVILNQSVSLVRRDKKLMSSQNEVVDVLKSKLRQALTIFRNRTERQNVIGPTTRM